MPGLLLLMMASSMPTGPGTEGNPDTRAISPLKADRPQSLNESPAAFLDRMGHRFRDQPLPRLTGVNVTGGLSRILGIDVQ